VRLAGLSGDRNGFTSQRGSVDLQPAPDEMRIGGHAVTLLEQDHIARHEIADVDQPAPSVADDGDLLGEEGSQGLDGALGLALL